MVYARVCWVLSFKMSRGNVTYTQTVPCCAVHSIGTLYLSLSKIDWHSYQNNNINLFKFSVVGRVVGVGRQFFLNENISIQREKWRHFLFNKLKPYGTSCTVE